MATPPRTKKDLNMAVTGLDTALEALARLYTNQDLAPDDTTLIRESYVSATVIRNHIADVSRRTQ